MGNKIFENEDVNGNKIELSTNPFNDLSIYLTEVDEDTEEEQVIRYVFGGSTEYAVKEVEKIIGSLQEWVKIAKGNWTVKELNGKTIR